MTLSPAESAAWGGLLATHKEVMALMSNEVERTHGLALNSYDVLRHTGLAGDRPLRMHELAERVMITRSGLTGVVTRLEAEGLVRRRRDSIDTRGWYVELTPVGWRVLRRVNATITAAIRRHVLDALSADDLDAMSRIWAKLAEHRRRSG